MVRLVFFFNDTATTEIYTLSLHDALPICAVVDQRGQDALDFDVRVEVLANHRQRVLELHQSPHRQDRKSTRLNSSHANISYAVFCLKKKKHKCSVLSNAPVITLKYASSYS